MVSYREPSTLATPTLRAELAVDILQPGTFKLTGTLTQAGGGPIHARVEVLSGIGQGLSASGFGSYALYGLSGPAQLRASVSAENFIAQVQDVVVNGPGVTQDFALSPTEPSADVSGDWTLTLVGPSSSCPAGFPAVARNRTYRLHVTQHGTSLGVVITAPSLQVIEPENVRGSVNGTRVQIALDDNLNDFTGDLSPNLFDHISATDTFAFGGDVVGTVNGPEVAAVFTATLRYWPGSAQSAPLWSCSAADHPVTLRR
jgi:hypothetical protein